jgi:PBP1b-binding outer membrane lipoprotein LpoB
VRTAFVWVHVQCLLGFLGALTSKRKIYMKKILLSISISIALLLVSCSCPTVKKDEQMKNVINTVALSYFTNLHLTSNPQAWTAHSKLIETVQEICPTECAELIQMMIDLKPAAVISTQDASEIL